MFVLRVADALERFTVPYAVVGGYAMLLHGAPRATFDVDIVLPFEDPYFVLANKAFASLGLRCRNPVTAEEVFNHRREYLEKRHMISWSFWNPSNPIEVVDVLMTHDLREFARTSFELDGQSIQTLTREDLIRMKRDSPREQDREDIEALELIG